MCFDPTNTLSFNLNANPRYFCGTRFSSPLAPYEMMSTISNDRVS